jgi:hypothetical protein
MPKKTLWSLRVGSVYLGPRDAYHIIIKSDRYGFLVMVGGGGPILVRKAQAKTTFI